MKKISREILVGVIAIAIVVLFVWLFSFLRGRKTLNSSDHYNAYYNNIAGLEVSSPVEMNGLKIGVVERVGLINDGSGIIKVDIAIEKGIILPEDSEATITTATLIAGMKIDIIPGKSSQFLNNGDTISGKVAESIINILEDGMNPILSKTSVLLSRLDTITTKMNSLLSDDFNSKLSSSVSNFDAASRELQLTVSENRKELGELISNLNSVSSVIDDNGMEIDSTLKNINRLANKLASSDIDTALVAFTGSLKESKEILEALNNGNGSAGKLLKDDSLYINLSRSLESLNMLLKDIEENPGRYVRLSIFGNKKK